MLCHNEDCTTRWIIRFCLQHVCCVPFTLICSPPLARPSLAGQLDYCKALLDHTTTSDVGRPRPHGVLKIWGILQSELQTHVLSMRRLEFLLLCTDGWR